MSFLIVPRDRNIDLERRLLHSNLKRHLKLSQAESEGMSKTSDFGLCNSSYNERLQKMQDISLQDGLLTEEFARIVGNEDIDSRSYLGLLNNRVGNCAVCAFLAEQLVYDTFGKRMDILWISQPEEREDHVVLYDNEKKVIYSFATGPFIRQHSEIPKKSRVMSELMMIQYCYMIGKTK